jgi:hypothetical protein
MDRALLGNWSLNNSGPNTRKAQKKEYGIFYAVGAVTAATQRCGKHFSTTIYVVFCVWSVRRLYNEIPGITKAVFQYLRVF